MDYLTLIETTDQILKHKDPQLGYHGRNVAELTSRLVRVVDPAITIAHLELINFGANLHDIGKIFLPDDLLHIPRRFTTQEMEAMKTHVSMGHRLSHDLNLHPFVHDIILYHHENVDGTGYLRGKIASEVPWYVRVVRICDCYDALTSNRSYRSAHSKESALTIMEAGKGSLFDGTLLNIFKDMV